MSETEEKVLIDMSLKMRLFKSFRERSAVAQEMLSKQPPVTFEQMKEQTQRVLKRAATSSSKKRT
jgi:hypothetical protein